jgi:hypothetical protein
MLRFPDRPGALPLNLIWGFETTSRNRLLAAGPWLLAAGFWLLEN